MNFHKNFSSNTPPNRFSLALLQKLAAAYKFWHKSLTDFPKTSRYTLASKIDSLFLKTIEFLIIAVNSSKGERVVYLNKSSVCLDLLKFFLQIAWEIKAIDNKKYIFLSEKLNEVGKMVGGWLKSLK